MKNIKFVAAFAACGFVLSLLFGIFSHTTFLSVILKALIFGIVFAILGFVISFVFNKFLLNDESNGDVDISSIVTKSSGSGNDDSKGHVVDITIKDEELPLGVSDNHFNVGDNHQMLNETDYGHEVQKQAVTVSDVAPDPNVSFKPVRNLETLTNVSSKESVRPDASVNETQTDVVPQKNEKVENTSSENEIDTLPDISGFAIDKTPTTDNESLVEDVDSESGSEFETTATRSISSSAEVPEIKDASLYAKAISSVLSGEED